MAGCTIVLKPGACCAHPASVNSVGYAERDIICMICLGTFLETWSLMCVCVCVFEFSGGREAMVMNSGGMVPCFFVVSISWPSCHI